MGGMNLKELDEARVACEAAANGPQPLVLPPLWWNHYKEVGLLSQDFTGKWYLYGAGRVVREEYAP